MSDRFEYPYRWHQILAEADLTSQIALLEERDRAIEKYFHDRGQCPLEFPFRWTQYWNALKDGEDWAVGIANENDLSLEILFGRCSCGSTPPTPGSISTLIADGPAYYPVVSIEPEGAFIDHGEPVFFEYHLFSADDEAGTAVITLEYASDEDTWTVFHTVNVPMPMGGFEVETTLPSAVLTGRRVRIKIDPGDLKLTYAFVQIGELPPIGELVEFPWDRPEGTFHLFGGEPYGEIFMSSTTSQASTSNTTATGMSNAVFHASLFTTFGPTPVAVKLQYDSGGGTWVTLAELSLPANNSYSSVPLSDIAPGTELRFLFEGLAPFSPFLGFAEVTYDEPESLNVFIFDS